MQKFVKVVSLSDFQELEQDGVNCYREGYSDISFVDQVYLQKYRSIICSTCMYTTVLLRQAQMLTFDQW